MAPWPHGDPDAVVRGILASTAYRHAPVASIVPPKKTWFDAFGKWFHDTVWEPFVHTFLRPIAHSLGATREIWNLVGAAVVVLAVLVLIFALYRLVVAFARSGSRDSDAGGATGIALVRSLSSAQWRARAGDAAQRGEHARAIAALFNAAVARLDERAIVPFDAARTPGEYRRLVRRERAAAAQPFGDLSARFVRAAYAEEPTGADDYAEALRAYAAFEPALV